MTLPYEVASEFVYDIELLEDARNPLKCLYSASPAYSGLVQVLFILPQRASGLMSVYLEPMERERD
jgi:hypothetical protein